MRGQLEAQIADALAAGARNSNALGRVEACNQLVIWHTNGHPIRSGAGVLSADSDDGQWHKYCAVCQSSEGAKAAEREGPHEGDSTR